jgi:hypothetical protein
VDELLAHPKSLATSLSANGAQEGQELLLREMDHRVKNLFALAISVVSLRGRSASGAVQPCIAEGLVGADGFAVDAGLIAADANKQRSVSSREWKPEEIRETATRAAQEYLATLDDAAFGAASPVTDVEATRAIRRAEVGAARTMLERTETRFGMKPALAADSAYGSADSLAWLVKKKEIAPHIPVFDKSNRTDTTFSRVISNSTPSATAIPVPRARSWFNSGAPTRLPGAA